MKKVEFIIFALLLVLIPAVVSAQGITALDTVRWEQGQRYKFYGGVEFSYRNYTEERNGVTTRDETAFMQRYSLGLSGYIWRPKLIIFSSDVSFMIYNQDPKNDSRNINFGFNSVVFPRTRFPLILFASRSTTTFDGYLGSGNDTTSTNFGARWGYTTLTNKKLILSYAHSTYDIKGDGSGDSTTVLDTFIVDFQSAPYLDRRKLYSNYRNNRNLNLNNYNNNYNNYNNNGNSGNNANNNSNNNDARKKIKLDLGLGITWGLTYEFQNYKTDDSMTSTDGEKSHRLRLHASRDIWRLFSAYSELVLYKQEDVKNMYLTINLKRQTERFYSYNNYNFSSLDDGKIKSTRHDIRTQNTYWHTKNLTFTAGASYNRYKQEGSDTSENYDMNLGVNYVKYFPSHVMQVYANTAFSPSSSTEDSYSAGYGIRFESLPKIYKSFTYKYSGAYTGTYDSKGDITNKIELDADAIRNFKRFTLISSAGLDYYMNSNEGSSESSGFTFNIQTNLYTRLTNYSTLSIKAQYILGRTSNASSHSLLLEERLNFILYRNLDLSVSALQRMNSSDGSDYKYYEVLTSLNYRLRKVYLHGEFNISNEDDNGTKIKKRTIYLRLTRPI
ncbi:MAG: hypothetical protein AB1632_10685 [Nitrospirota bacterium]